MAKAPSERFGVFLDSGDSVKYVDRKRRVELNKVALRPSKYKVRPFEKLCRCEHHVML